MTRPQAARTTNVALHRAGPRLQLERRTRDCRLSARAGPGGNPSPAQSRNLRRLLDAGPPDGTLSASASAFCVRQADGLLSGKIDRLVLLERSRKVQAADVIDFKTDRLSGPDDLDAAWNFIDRSWGSLRLAVAGLYRLEPADTMSRLVFLESGGVRSVS